MGERDKKSKHKTSRSRSHDHKHKKVSRSNSNKKEKHRSDHDRKKKHYKDKSRSRSRDRHHKDKSRSRSRDRKRRDRSKSYTRRNRNRSPTPDNKEMKLKMRQARARALKFEVNDSEDQPQIQEKSPEQLEEEPEQIELPPSMPQEIQLEEQKKMKKQDDDWLEQDNEEQKANNDEQKAEEEKVVQEEEEEEEDELDAFMKTIQKEVEVVQEKINQDDSFYQALINAGVKDKRGAGKPQFDITAVPMPEDFQSVEEEMEKMDEEQQIDHTKVMTWEDIQKLQQNQPAQIEQEDEQDDAFYNEFVKALKPEVKQDIQEVKKEQKSKLQDEFQSDDETDYMIPDKVIEEDGYLEQKKKFETRKELTQVNHEEVEYLPFRKNFYIETKEIKEMSTEEVQQFRFELGDLKVRGKDPLNPIKNWYQCGLSDKILNYLIVKKKFLKPFPIQNQCIPAIMAGRDVIGIAETGSGKTLAYLLPLLRHILDQPPLQEGDGPIGIIMAPTRELATQIFFESKHFAKAIGINVVCVYGGAGIQGQLTDLKRGAEIVVCTPGRMIDVLCTSNGKITNLKRCTYIVLDEADRMFDLGFEPQITKIIQNVRPDRQTVLATFPRNIEQLAKKILIRPLEIVVGSRGQACQNVEQVVEFMDLSDKFWRLLELLGEWNNKGSILIFVDKQSEADELFKELLKYGYFPLVLHGGQDQTDREFTILDYKKGVRNIMVATSVCARGLDISSISLVVNFKCPTHIEDYIHRIGRTGRAGQQGTAVTFFTKDDESFSPELLQSIKQSKCSEVPAQLEKMVEDFYAKVKKGEAQIYSNKNLTGTGFKFDERESKKSMDVKSQFKRQINLEQGIDEDDITESEIFKKKDEDLTEEEKLQLAKADRRIKRQCIEMIKDPNIKLQVMQAATRAAKEAILNGKKSDDVLTAAQESIKKVIAHYKPNGQSTLDVGMENVMKVRDELLDLEIENSDMVSAEIEINDYPINCRQKVINRDFQYLITDLTECTVSLRGIYVEPSKKVPIGSKKLYLLIKGETKYNVTTAYKEVKRILEEAAMTSLTRDPTQDNKQQSGGLGGNQGGGGFQL